MRRRRALQLAVALWLPLSAAGVHYGCSADEVVGEVQGETGVVCGPRCSETTFNCPTDVPFGTSAQPQCILQDIDQAAYCGLLCQTDAQCPSGDSCRRAGMQGVSICIRPMSFGDWAKQDSRKRLVVGWPSKAGQSATGFRIAKAYAALQSLKRRYGVADGDPDVLVVKELLSAASSTSASDGARLPPAPGPPAQGAPLRGPQFSLPSDQRDFGAGAWEHDVNYFAKNMAQGLPGLQREVHDTMWNVEHINGYGVATSLLRSILLFAAVYLIIGAVYKNQTLGATGIDMIPHLGFWKEYPALVADGVKYASLLLNQAMGKPPPSPLAGGFSGGLGGSSGSASYQPIGASDRDTFGNFEPSL